MIVLQFLHAAELQDFPSRILTDADLRPWPRLAVQLGFKYFIVLCL